MKSKILKRAVSLLCASTITIGMLAGCGGNKTTSSNTQAEKEVKEEKTISAMIVQSQNKPGIQKIFDKLKDEHNISMDIQIFPDEQYMNVLQMKQAAGELTDLIEYNIPHIYDIINAEENLYDLSGESWVDNLADPSVTQRDGKQYGFPFCSSTGYQAITYNKDIFDKYNIEIPTTVEEFDKVCQTLKSNEVTPILVASDLWVPQIWTTTGFARAFGDDAKAQEAADKIFSGQAKFNDYPQFAEVVDEFLALNKKGYFNEDIATLSYDDSLIKLSEGKGGMILAENSIMSVNKDAFPDTHFGIFNVPMNYDKDGYLSVARFSAGFVVNKACKDIETVKEMFNIISKPEYADLYFTDGNTGFPAFKDGDGGELQQDVLDLYDSKKQENKLVSEMNLNWSPIETLMSEYLWVYYSEALIKGELDGKAIFDKFQKDVDKYMKQNGVEGF